MGFVELSVQLGKVFKSKYFFPTYGETPAIISQRKVNVQSRLQNRNCLAHDGVKIDATRLAFRGQKMFQPTSYSQ